MTGVTQDHLAEGPAPAAQPVRETGVAETAQRGSIYVLSVLTLAYVINLIDRKLPFILVEPIRKELHLSDTQIGLLTGAMFMLIYCAASLPMAKIADRFSRKWVLVASITVWSALTSTGGLALNFWQLAVARAGVAVGESGCMPASHSMLADIFPKSRRATVAAVFMAGAPIGMLLGLAGGGIINDLFSWRTAMIMVGAPGILVGLLIAFTIKEPVRVVTEEERSTVSIWGALVTLFSSPAFRHLAIASVLSSLVGAAAQSFGPAFLMRTFGYSTTETGIKYGLIVGVGGIVGAVLGGWVNDRLRKRDVRWGLWFVAGVVAISGPAQILAWQAKDFTTFAVMMFLPQVAFMITAGPVISSVQFLAGTRLQATAVAIYLLMTNGLGVSLGPVMAGMLSDGLKPRFGVASLAIALIILAMLKFWAAIHYFLAANRFKGEAERLPV